MPFRVTNEHIAMSTGDDASLRYFFGLGVCLVLCDLHIFNELTAHDPRNFLCVVGHSHAVLFVLALSLVLLLSVLRWCIRIPRVPGLDAFRLFVERVGVGRVAAI